MYGFIDISTLNCSLLELIYRYFGGGGEISDLRCPIMVTRKS